MDDIPTTWLVRLSEWGKRKRRFVQPFILLLSVGVALTLLLPSVGVGAMAGINGPVAVAIAPSHAQAKTEPSTSEPSTSEPSTSEPSTNAQDSSAPPPGDSEQPGTDGYVPKEAITIKQRTAPVVLDGQILFEVTAYKNITADARAYQISQALDRWADKKQLPVITIEEGQGTTSIVLTNLDGFKVNLITVTKADASQDLVTPQSQAEQWAVKIRKTLRKAQSERNPEALGRSILLATVAFFLTGLLFWYLRHIKSKASKRPVKHLKRLLKGNIKRDGILIQIRQVSMALCIELVSYGIWVAVILYITQLFPVTRRVSYDITTRLFAIAQLVRAILLKALASLSNDILPLGGKVYSIVDVLILIAGFWVLIAGSTLITNVLKTRILQLAGISAGAQQAIATLSRYTLIALGTLVMLQLWGLDLSSLTIIASALGVGIGFGLQNIARDFSSGVVLLFERPIQVGDFIEVGQFQGTVDRIGSRSTMIKTLDQVSVIVPNSYFLDNHVVNWSHDNPLSRISIPVGVSFQANPETVKSLLIQAGTAHKGVLQIPAPQVLFKGFGENSLNFELLVWVVEPNRQPIICSDLNFNVFNLLQEHGIEIPYPQRDLHIRTGHLSPSLADQSMRPSRAHSPSAQPQNRSEVQDNESAMS